MLVHPVQYTLLYFVGKVLHAWIKSYVACLSRTSLSFAYYRHNIFLFAQYICLYWCHLSNFHCLSRIFEAINVHRQKCTGTHLSSCSPMSWGLLALFRCSKNTSLAKNEVAVDKELHFLRRSKQGMAYTRTKIAGYRFFFYHPHEKCTEWKKLHIFLLYNLLLLLPLVFFILLNIVRKLPFRFLHPVTRFSSISSVTWQDEEHLRKLKSVLRRRKKSTKVMIYKSHKYGRILDCSRDKSALCFYWSRDGE